MVEQLICNQQVGGSSPSTGSRQALNQIISYGGFPEWPKGTDCKSAGYAFGGSNPPSPTKPNPDLMVWVFGLVWAFGWWVRTHLNAMRMSIAGAGWTAPILNFL